MTMPGPPATRNAAVNQATSTVRTPGGGGAAGGADGTPCATRAAWWSPGGFGGAGRVTCRRASWLEAAGVTPAGYVDVDPRKAPAGRLPCPVILPDELPAPDRACVVSWVGKRGARELIRAHLQTAGFREGEDFLLAA